MRISDWSSDLSFVRQVVLRGDDQAARILVDAVDDAGPRDAADARKLSRAMVEQRVDERAVEIARGGVDDHAGGLVDDDQMLIPPGDDEIEVLRGVMRRGGDGKAQAQRCGRPRFGGGGPENGSAVVGDAADIYPRLHPSAP